MGEQNAPIVPVNCPSCEYRKDLERQLRMAKEDLTGAYRAYDIDVERLKTRAQAAEADLARHKAFERAVMGLKRQFASAAVGNMVVLESEIEAAHREHLQGNSHE